MTTITYSNGKHPITFDCERIDETLLLETVGDILNRIPQYVLFQVQLVPESSYTEQDILAIRKASESKKGVKKVIDKIVESKQPKSIFCTWYKLGDDYKHIFDSDENAILRADIKAIIFNGVEYVITH